MFVRHVREAKLCMDGTRIWFSRRGWSWSSFVSEGRAIRDFEETGCPLAARAAVIARQEVADGFQ